MTDPDYINDPSYVLQPNGDYLKSTGVGKFERIQTQPDAIDYVADEDFEQQPDGSYRRDNGDGTSEHIPTTQNPPPASANPDVVLIPD